MHIKKVISLGNWKQLGTEVELRQGQWYYAMDATNQPDWKENGLMFVGCERDGGGHPILLKRGEYEMLPHPYTVILMYPDYLSGDNATFMETINAIDPAEAVSKARASIPDLDDPVDMKVIAVIAGDHQDINPES